MEKIIIEVSLDEFETITKALAVHYMKLMKSKSKKIRESCRAMELSSIKMIYDKIKELEPK